jgi:hypothetical protein
MAAWPTSARLASGLRPARYACHVLVRQSLYTLKRSDGGSCTPLQLAVIR